MYEVLVEGRRKRLKKLEKWIKRGDLSLSVVESPFPGQADGNLSPVFWYQGKDPVAKAWGSVAPLSSENRESNGGSHGEEE